MSNGFLGQDWSWENFKNRGQGILSDPESLATNPWFQAGMGVLSENQKPYGGDPFGAFAGAMQTTKERKQADEDRKRIQELRAQIADLIRQQMMGRQTGYTGVQMPDGTTYQAPYSPIPQNQQQPRSIMELMRASGMR